MKTVKSNKEYLVKDIGECFKIEKGFIGSIRFFNSNSKNTKSEVISLGMNKVFCLQKVIDSFNANNLTNEKVIFDKIIFITDLEQDIKIQLIHQEQ